jgi:hypothetical protein
MSEPTFDIFSGTSDKDAYWLEFVEGLSKARERLEQIAAARPGAYFLYCPAGSDGRCNTLWSFDLALRFKRTDP